jgi:mRNA interferase YafQ
MNRLKEAMLLLIANDAPLGWWLGRSRHIGSDFLLTYKLVESAKHDLMVLVRTGTDT